ncbi:MAG TPA: hypothetical protein DF613_12885, partial [Lachnospiraceae bacterium]|nr:hypothetical protein [Lachnospiraceae bacterium]
MWKERGMAEVFTIEKIKRYGKKSEYTYIRGAFPTFEALQCSPENMEAVIVGTELKADILKKLHAFCESGRILFLKDDRLLDRVREKEKCLVVGVLRKYEDALEQKQDHLVLVNPMDMGNLGTILRTCAGFGIKNLAVIEPAADLFHPKVIRASMGAIFRVHAVRYPSFEAYLQQNGRDRMFYTFMLQGTTKLPELYTNGEIPCSLIFGNEAAGLDDGYINCGQSVVIPHNGTIDSLNLSMAVGIALYEFTKKAPPGSRVYGQ